MEAFSEEEMEKERKRIELSMKIREIQRSISNEYQTKTKLESQLKITFEIDKKIEELLVLYKQTHDEIKQYLPKIKDLVEEGILYVIVSLHGAISDEPKNIKIPRSTVFFKAMTSDYGAISCDRYDTNHVDSLFHQLKTLISHDIHVRKNKGTRRNNIKFMKKTMKNVLNKINNNMDFQKSLKIKDPSEMRYFISKGHVHLYEHGGDIVEKEYQIELNAMDTFDQILVINKKYPHLNLVDYLNLDIPTTSKKPIIHIDMRDVFKLFKGIKYIFFVDQSCSALFVEDEYLSNRAQNIAEGLEGKSITQYIQNYANVSPYNTNNMYREPSSNNNNASNDYSNIPPPPPLRPLTNLEKEKRAKNARVEHLREFNSHINKHFERKKDRIEHYAKLLREHELAKVEQAESRRRREAQLLKDIANATRKIEEAEAEKKKYVEQLKKSSRSRSRSRSRNQPFYVWKENNNAHEAAFNNSRSFHNPFWKRSTKNSNSGKTKKWGFW
jgi:hypothetical protein